MGLLHLYTVFLQEHCRQASKEILFQTGQKVVSKRMANKIIEDHLLSIQATSHQCTTFLSYDFAASAHSVHHLRVKGYSSFYAKTLP